MSKTTELPSLIEQSRFHEIGIETDELGRPLHPWRDQLPHLAEGKGCYWRWGPNYTVDPIVISREPEPKILLVQRGDNGKWALPGGFIDPGEAPNVAGLREIIEETHLELTDDESHLCYRGPVLDERSRLHAWSDTTAILWHSPTATAVCGGDDARDAKWFTFSELRQLECLHGSHAALIEMAIHEHGTLQEQLAYFGELSESVHPQGGHMGYTRLVTTLPNGNRIFVKRHDEHKFTDSTRAEHSRRYLHKEYHVYEQLQGATRHIPAHVELTGDHTLLLEAFDPRDGWHWKAPDDSAMLHQYVDDILTALRSLEPLTYAPFEEIKSSYQTIIDEGWGTFETQREQIVAKLTGSSIDGAMELADDLDALYSRASTLTMPELTHFAHYDIRQSNIAWHPEQGVRIVDWSWADRAPGGIDTTSFLIDLAKAGHDVTDYLEDFNTEHALLLIGFWLGHSVWLTPTEDQTVREHQIASAVAAHMLMCTQ
jgi:ADP-ribose pyrophosphatase YjhB (NUDIX family)